MRINIACRDSCSGSNKFQFGSVRVSLSVQFGSGLDTFQTFVFVIGNVHRLLEYGCVVEAYGRIWVHTGA